MPARAARKKRRSLICVFYFGDHFSAVVCARGYARLSDMYVTCIFGYAKGVVNNIKQDGDDYVWTTQ